MSAMMERVGECIRAAGRMAVLTGAGISAESGVPTFRGPGSPEPRRRGGSPQLNATGVGPRRPEGDDAPRHEPDALWKTYRPEDLATPEAFARDPKLVWEWYDWRRQKVSACEPNAGHRALVRIEESVSDFTLVTQNVDGLHRAAGSRNVVEVHGDIWRLRCTGCRHVGEDRRTPLSPIPPRCECGGLLRPDVVWFGEPLPEDAVQTAVDACSRAEVMLVVGTSALVYPAAALPRVAKQRGSTLVEINAEETPLTSMADVALTGKAAEILPEVCRAAGID